MMMMMVMVVFREFEPGRVRFNERAGTDWN